MAVIISRRFSYCPNFATAPPQVYRRCPWSLLPGGAAQLLVQSCQSLELCSKYWSQNNAIERVQPKCGSVVCFLKETNTTFKWISFILRRSSR